jgi:hypothetical protein
MQSVPITTDVVSSNLDQGEVYNIKVCQAISELVTAFGKEWLGSDEKTVLCRHYNVPTLIAKSTEGI